VLAKFKADRFMLYDIKLAKQIVAAGKQLLDLEIKTKTY